jgi:hypothetical protein
VIALLLAAPGAAGAHVRPMTERQLHRFETQLLGPQHAAQHAAMRLEQRVWTAGCDRMSRQTRSEFRRTD